MTQTDVLQALKAFKLSKSSEYGIQALGIFGSTARGQTNPDSDLDVVVQLKKQDLFNLIGIKQDLQELFHITVDVVSYRTGMDAFLKAQIDKDAVYV